MQGSCSLAGDVRTAGLGWSASFQLLLFQPKSRKTMTVLKRVPYVQPFLFVLYSAPFKASGSAGVCNGLAGLSPYSGFSSFPLALSPAFSLPVFARAAPSPGNELPSPHLLCKPVIPQTQSKASCPAACGLSLHPASGPAPK